MQCFGSAQIRRCGGAPGESPALTLGRCRQQRRHGHGVVPLLEGVAVELHYTTLREKSLASVVEAGVDGGYVVSFFEASPWRVSIWQFARISSSTGTVDVGAAAPGGF